MASETSENMKRKYYELINQYCRNKPQHALMREKWINIMIKRVIYEKETGASDRKKNSKANYDVITIDDKPVLVKKPKGSKAKHDKNSKIVIAIERSFEIVYNAHLCTGHGTISEMYKWIDKCNYVLNSICTPILREVCASMNIDCTSGYVSKLNIIPLGNLHPEPLSNPRPKEGIATITILDMTLQPDNYFQYLLAYKDLETSFLQLRPFKAIFLVEEIAMELFKIFCDFSPPLVIMVDKEMKDTFAAVLDRWNTTFQGKISLETCDQITVDPMLESQLRDWMLETESDNWSVGCYFVQWNMNKKKSNKDSRSAYEKFFGIRVVREKPADKDARRCTKILKSADKKQTSTLETVQNSTPMTIYDTQISKNVSQISTNDNQSSKTKPQVSDNIIRGSVILKNPAKCQSNSTTVQSFTISTSKDSSTDVTSSTMSNKRTIAAVRSATISEVRPTTPPVTSATISNFKSTRPTISEVKVTSVEHSEDDKHGISCGCMETHVCNTCELTITTQVYNCYVCKRNLHLYCSGSKQDSNGDMQTVCFLCI